MSALQGLVESMRKIQADCPVDAKALDGEPFTPLGVGTAFGNVLAMVEACARAIETLALQFDDDDDCDNYSAGTSTAAITVERLDDGRIGITIDGKESTADWILTSAEARQVAMGIVTVIR